jgi:hypothetical protein
MKQVQLELAKQGKTIAQDEQEIPAAKPERLCPCCKKGVMVVIEILAPKGRSPPWAGVKRAASRKI